MCGVGGGEGLLSTVGVFSTLGNIMSTMGDIMSTVRDIMSTMEDIIFCYLSTSMVLNTPCGTDDIPHVS